MERGDFGGVEHPCRQHFVPALPFGSLIVGINGGLKAEGVGVDDIQMLIFQTCRIVLEESLDTDYAFSHKHGDSGSHQHLRFASGRETEKVV